MSAISTSLVSLSHLGSQGLCCCCSVAQSCPTLCDPMDCSTLGFPVLHSLLEFAQTHVHWVGDAIFTISPSVAPFFSRPPYLGFGPPSFSTLLTTGQSTQRMCSRHISRLATSLAWQLGDITLARLPPPSMGGGAKNNQKSPSASIITPTPHAHISAASHAPQSSAKPVGEHR